MGKKHRISSGLIVRFAILGGVAIGLIGCQSVREVAGVSKDAPDEFAVVTKAPLIIPPDFNLHPPKPGAAPTNQSSPTDSAQTALFGDDPATVAASLPNTYSSAEKNLLANTGGATANHGIRQQIAADTRSMATANDSFTDRLLFLSGPDPNAGHPLDADAEHDRLLAAKSNSQTPIEGEKKDSQEKVAISKNGESSEKNSSGDNSGWFGWINDVL